MVLIQNISFDKSNITENPLEEGEYERCVFKNCDFSNADLSEFQFTDCEFIGCNLSIAKVTRTAFRNIQFLQTENKKNTFPKL